MLLSVKELFVDDSVVSAASLLLLQRAASSSSSSTRQCSRQDGLLEDDVSFTPIVGFLLLLTLVGALFVSGTSPIGMSPPSIAVLGSSAVGWATPSGYPNVGV